MSRFGLEVVLHWTAVACYIAGALLFASAVIFGKESERVLLTRRTDNGLWCLPGGGMDAGESATEACVREVFEEWQRFSRWRYCRETASGPRL